MIIKDHVEQKYVFIQKQNDKEYYNNIIQRKYTININMLKTKQKTIIQNKIKKLYDR